MSISRVRVTLPNVHPFARRFLTHRDEAQIAALAEAAPSGGPQHGRHDIHHTQSHPRRAAGRRVGPDPHHRSTAPANFADSGENGGAGPYAVCVGVAVILTAVLFGRVLPATDRPLRAAWILAALALVTCLAPWSGLPFTLGIGAVYSGARAGRAALPRQERLRCSSASLAVIG